MDTYVPNPANDPVTIMVPDDTSDEWTASVINTPTESTADSVAFLRSKIWLASENWPAGMELWDSTMLPSGQTLAFPPVWDGCFARWLAFIVDASGGAATSAYMVESEDGRWWRATTGNIGTNPGTPPFSGFASLQGMWVRPTDGAILRMINYAGAGGSVTQLQSNSGSTLAANIGALTPPSSGDWWSGAYLTVSGIFSLWLGGGSGIAPVWSNGTTALATAITWSPPVGFVIHNLAHVVINGASSCLAVIFPSGTSVVGSYMSTADGRNWQPGTMPTFTLSGESVIDAAVDTFTSTIYLLTGNGSNANLWSIPATLVGAWTLVKTFAVPCYAIKANGREVVVWAKFGTSYNGSSLVPAYRALVSINPAATPGTSVWYAVGLTSTTNAPGMYFCLRANGKQFMYVNTSEFAASAAAPLVSLATGV